MKKFEQCPWSMGTKNFEVEFAIFLEHLREYERCCQLEEAQDAFLDAYSAWRKHPRDRAMKARLIRCAAHLSSLDPTFRGPRALRHGQSGVAVGKLF